MLGIEGHFHYQKDSVKLKAKKDKVLIKKELLIHYFNSNIISQQIRIIAIIHFVT